MFTTFVGTSRSKSSSFGESSSKNGAPPPPPPPLPQPKKRSQVSRACDWCRVHRVKCDNNRPCNNCRSRGASCSNNNANEVRTLPLAFREIERLRQRVQELESELQNRSHPPDPELINLNNQDHQDEQHTAPSLDPFADTMTSASKPARQIMGGIYMSTTDLPQKQWFGPSSLYYFINRMHSYLAVVLHQPAAPAEEHIGNNDITTNRPLLDESSRSEADHLVPEEDDNAQRFLTAAQEEHFLGLFWDSYHSSMQIVDETSLKTHYAGLWRPDKTSRRPSALVDIILALCMQCEGVPSRAHYDRCQALLLPELESPTLAALQSQLFSVIWLCCASLQNMAHATLALAVRTAHMLGLHLDPSPPAGSSTMTLPECELRRRLWWTLYTVESKTCMKLGRPWSAPLSESTCALPADDLELCGSYISAGLREGGVTWLTYTVQNTKLVLAARQVYVAFWQKCQCAAAGRGFYEDVDALEDCAVFLETSMEGSFGAFLRDMPAGLKTARKEGGERFSTDRSPLAVVRDGTEPLWLQRQRVLLELLYHNLAMNLYRPFICFRTNPPSRLSKGTPAADRCAAACVGHAVAMTHMIHQVLVETPALLDGWHEAFQWQWNTAMTTIGFILAYPASPAAVSARASVDLAVRSFEIFGNVFAVAVSAAGVTRDLAKKADFINGSRGVGDGLGGSAELILPDSTRLGGGASMYADGPGPSSFSGGGLAECQLEHAFFPNYTGGEIDSLWMSL
ncbi:fungal-specific transcription factor domain-containing protein [Cercophora scortea]|uniref:Fungal-specific transcription factor domain-containing protein n=1 Tax=Cercophora scortea TaxID=314031 RepID=A0AAE0IAG5_9PEZI|nr:fungal-specific transcription factor domain-containing protein [Cercophora scortea]